MDQTHDFAFLLGVMLPREARWYAFTGGLSRFSRRSWFATINRHFAVKMGLSPLVAPALAGKGTGPNGTAVCKVNYCRGLRFLQLSFQAAPGFLH